MANTINDLLPRLKIDIGIINSTVYDERLLTVLKAAEASVNQWIGEEVDLNKDLDSELVIDYARWQWLTRREPTSMPDSLKYRLNCRQFAKYAEDPNHD